MEAQVTASASFEEVNGLQGSVDDFDWSQADFCWLHGNSVVSENDPGRRVHPVDGNGADYHLHLPGRCLHRGETAWGLHASTCGTSPSHHGSASCLSVLLHIYPASPYRRNDGDAGVV